MKNSPLVSICIPTYNGETYLAKCLDSLLSQTYKNFEVVVIDDYSNDSTCKILRSYAEKDQRIRVGFNKENLGLVENWNLCISKCNGDLIKFLFQDDYLSSNCLDEMVRVSTSRCSLITICKRNYIFESNHSATRKAYEELTGPLSVEKLFHGVEYITSDSLCSAVIQHGTRNFLGEPSAFLIHRDAFTKFGGFDKKLIQLCDFEFIVRVGNSQGISYAGKAEAYFRIHATNTTFANKTDKEFMTKIVDPLLVRFKFAFHEKFQKLREVALLSGVNIRSEYYRTLWNERKNIVKHRSALDPETLKILKIPLRFKCIFLFSNHLIPVLDKHIFWRIK